MGSCMSSKSKGALACAQQNTPAKLRARLLGSKMEKKNKTYRGTATSFGFKKPVASNIPNSNSKIPSLQNSLPPKEVLTDSAESLNNAPNRNGTPRLSRNKKDVSNALGKPNRFGFRTPTALSNKVADSQNSLNSSKTNLRLEGLHDERKQSQNHPARSHLPRPQFPVRLVAPAGYRGRSTTAADKSAKTAANNHTARRSRSEHGGSSASSVSDGKSGNELEMIEQLECSPSARNRLRNAHKSRPMEMIFSNGNEKKFELRDLRDSIEVTEIVPLELPPLPLGKRLPQDQGLVRQRAKEYIRHVSQHSGSSEDDEGIEDEAGEEKVHRDRVLSEKDERGVLGAGDEAADGAGEDLWGHGEAMVNEDDIPGSQDDCDQDIDDSPGSPGTPTHTSNSLSFSSDNRDRDFIDDEICDQPGLMYDNVTGNSSGNTIVADDICPSPRVVKPLSVVANLLADCDSHRPSSAGTLSPCESITSDDLIMDFDISAVDDDHRLDGSSIDLPLSEDEEEAAGKAEKLLQDCKSLLSATRPDVLEGTWLMNGVRATRQLRPRVGSSGSGAESPRSQDTPRLRSGSALSSPLRSSRQGTSSPGEDLSEDSGIRVQRGTYQSMYQDVINIKALLLRLSRVVQEQSESETTHENGQKNGFYLASAEPVKGELSQQERILDLERQVVFLRSQVEEKDRTIRALQTTQLTRPPEPRGRVDTCNAATQTERVRPLSTGPILSTQSDSSGGSFVSNSSESSRTQVNSLMRPASRLPQWHNKVPPQPPVRRQT